MNKKHRSLMIALMIALTTVVLLPGEALSVQAAGKEYVVNQPGGAEFQVLNRGDEWVNWITTVDGYTVAQGPDDVWYYVSSYRYFIPELSGSPADREAPALLPRNLRPQVAAPLSPDSVFEQLMQAPHGDFTGSVLFILTEFTDRAGATNEASWAQFISSDIADYFDRASFSKVALLAADETAGTANNGVVGWVNVGYNHPNTAANTGTVNQQLTRDAILGADAFVDFASFDTDSDGFVDADELAVVVIAAGYERSYSGAYSPSVWGHKWSIFGTVNPPVVDGVTIGAYHSGAGGYAQFGELHRSSDSNQHQATMGIMVHELGHLVFGLPDLYDTDGSSSGIGAFGVMGAGSWGQAPEDTYSGETPVLPSAWTLYDRGWATGAEGNGVATVHASGMAGATAENTVFRASSPMTDEYFLVQNRQPVGYDRGLDRWLGTFGGLAVWHVDDTRTNNSDDNHRWVDIEEADGSVMGGSLGEATDLWYSGNATDFDALSDPNSNLYDGTPSGVAVNGISASGDVMTADFGGGGAGHTFTIYNDGSQTLTVTSMQLDLPGNWISWSPDAPFDVTGGSSQQVEVTVDFNLAPAGESTRRLLVASNDPDENPYPGGVMITVENATLCFHLTRTQSGSGTEPSASPSTLGCPAEQYAEGEQFQLEASPAQGWEVGGWTGTDNDGSTATTNTATMPAQAHTVSVTYIETAGVDLALAKDADQDQVAAGGLLAYTLAVTNLGGADSSGGEVTDILPAALSFAGSPDDCSAAAQTVTCPFGPLVADAMVEKSFFVLVDPDASGTILNTATVTGAESDPVAGNDSATHETIIAPPVGELSTLPDLNANGAEELAVLARRPEDGGAGVFPYDASSGTRIATTWLSKYYVPLALADLPDFSGTMAPEVAVLSRRPTDGAVGVFVHDASSRQRLKSIWFPRTFTPLALAAVDDFEGTIAAEVAVLSRRASDGGVGVFVSDAWSAARLRSVWFPKTFLPLDLAAVADFDGPTAPEVAVLARRPDDDAVGVFVHDASSGERLRSLWFPRSFTPVALAEVTHFDGTAAPEVAVVSWRESDGGMGVFVSDASSGERLQTIWLPRNFRPVALVEVAHFGGTAAPEVAVLARRASDGGVGVFVSDASSGERLQTIWIPSSFTPLALAEVADLGDSAASELAVLGRRSSDGLVRLFVHDASSGTLLRQIDLPADFVP